VEAAGPVFDQSLYHFLVFEISDATLPIFHAVLDKLVEKFQSVSFGFFTVFVICGLLKFPLIDRDRHSFRFVAVADLDDCKLPPISCTVFDVRNDGELFLSYVEFLKTLPPVPSRLSVLSLVENLDRYCVRGRIPVTLFTHGCFVHDQATLRGFATGRAFDHAIHIELFVYNNPADLSALGELSLYMNSRVHFCAKEEADIVPSMVIHSLFEYKVGDVVMHCLHSPTIKIMDILGAGVRLSDRAFGLTSMGVDDAVYFYFEYDVSTIRPLAPAIQFQVRYFDPLGRRVIRV
jgi:hypothetical protein